MHKFLSVVVFAFLVLFASGCGNKAYVQGKVHYPDGSPVSAGRVRFTAGDKSYSCKIASDGSYRIGSYRDGDGIPPGTYKISITGAYVFMDPPPGEPYPVSVQLVAKKYTDPGTSGIVCDTTASKNFDIAVEKPGPDDYPVYGPDNP